MAQYKNSPEGFLAIKRKLLFTLIPVMVVIGASALIGMAYDSDDFGEDLGILFGIGALFVIIFIVVIRGAIKGQKAIHDSYSLTVENEQLVRDQLHSPQMVIPFHEIDRIVEGSNRSLCIVGQHKNDIILIIPQIENYESLRSELLDMMPLSATKSDLLWRKYGLALLTVPLLLMACLYMSSNKYIVIVTGSLLLVILGWSFYKIRTNKNLSQKFRRSSWWTIWILIMIIIIMYQKLMW